MEILAGGASLPPFEDFNDGVPDFFEVQSRTWFIDGANRYKSQTAAGMDSISLLDMVGSLPANLQVDALIRGENGGSGFLKNAVLIFDYRSASDFKFAGGFFGANQWRIGYLDGTNWVVDVSFAETIGIGTDYDAELLIQGVVATLSVGEISKVTFDFGTALNSGGIGMGTRNAVAAFDDFGVTGS